jgi:hypothetical protein
MEFRRDPDQGGLNAMLNYGYAIVRAAVARALIAAGLLPALGLFHSNRANAFCLADDLVEPLRPLVDDRARDLFRQGYEELSQEAKARLLEILSEPVRLGRRRALSRVPSEFHVSNNLQAVCQGPNSSGKLRQGEPVLRIQRIPSTIVRGLRGGRPVAAGLGKTSLIRFHSSSVSNGQAILVVPGM